MLAVPSAMGEPEDTDDAPQTLATPKADAHATFIADVCRRIETAAQRRKLPPAFFARLIWKESRFNPNAVSPKGASGIAQFMPGTARTRGLEDPFDPRTAIPAAAHYLSELRDELGNLGLAAAAYNAGVALVRRWRAGRGGLPGETRSFVRSITGFSAHEWTGAKAPEAEFVLDKKLSFLDACRLLPTRRFRPHLRFASYSGAPWQPWGVHLAAAWSPTRALARYAVIQRAFSAMLAGKDPMVVRAVDRSRGRSPRFKILIGQPDRGAAGKFCRQLRRVGGACLVSRNRRR